MGRPKLLLPYGRSTIIETVLSRLLASKVDRVLVVLGAGAPRLRERIGRFPVDMIFNPRFRRGMLSSIHRGLAALPRSARAVAIVLADQPAIPPAVLDSLIGVFNRGRKGIVLPVYRGGRGHPLLLDLKFRREIMALDSGTGLRELLRRHPDEVVEVVVSTPSVLRDIDRPGDYLRARRGPGKKSK